MPGAEPGTIKSSKLSVGTAEADVVLMATRRSSAEPTDWVRRRNLSETRV